MPAARNCTAKTVLPLPAVPEMSVVRFFGSPPLAMMSKLEIPVRELLDRGHASPFSLSPFLLRRFRHEASDRALEEARPARTSSPSSTFSLSERSPITRRSGGGSCLISVGVARIFSSSASCGCSRTSMISSSYCPSSSWSQMRLQVGDRDLGAGARAGDVELQKVFRQTTPPRLKVLLLKALRTTPRQGRQTVQAGPPVALLDQDIAPKGVPTASRTITS